MIKLIIFDLSGVVANAEEPIYLEQFAKKHNIPLEKLEEVYFSYLKPSERNEIPLSKVWENTLKAFNIKGNYKVFIKEMMALKKFNQEVLDFIRELKKNFKTAYFTNYAEEYWKMHEQMVDLGPYFDYGVVSYRIGSRKPERKGFEAILNHFGLKPEEAFFTDDSEKNVQAAQEMGIHAFQFKNLKQFKEELKKYAEI